MHYNEIIGGWTLPFIGADKSIIERSERYLSRVDKTRRTQVQTYFKTDGLIMSILMIIGLAFLGVMTQFRFGVYLLETVSPGTANEQSSINYIYDDDDV